MKLQQGINEHLDWSFDWRRLLDTGETIVSATWTPADGLDWDTDSHAGTLTTCFFSGGVVGQSYLITCTMTTSAPRTFERSFKLKIVANP